MDARSKGLFRQAWPRQLAFLVFLAGILFGPASTLDYWQGWLFLLVFVGSAVALGLYFAQHDPALLERRMQAGPFAEQEPAQKIIITLLMANLLLLIVVPALNHRFHWSAVPAWVSLLGEVMIAASFVVFFFVMKQNSYAAATVRVETAQPVIATGLYGRVRHPMYSGALLMMFGIPLALASYWSLLLLIPATAILAWRLTDEERHLVRDLPGYAHYRRQVRFRLLPGVW